MNLNLMVKCDLRTLEMDDDSYLQLGTLYLLCHHSKVYIHSDAINKHARIQKKISPGGGGEDIFGNFTM